MITGHLFSSYSCNNIKNLGGVKTTVRKELNNNTDNTWIYSQNKVKIVGDAMLIRM